MLLAMDTAMLAFDVNFLIAFTAFTFSTLLICAIVIGRSPMLDCLGPIYCIFGSIQPYAHDWVFGSSPMAQAVADRLNNGIQQPQEIHRGGMQRSNAQTDGDGLIDTAVRDNSISGRGIDSLPSVGRQGQWLFPSLLAAWDCLRNERGYLVEGYEKYLCKGMSYVFPTLSGRQEIIIPHSKLHRLLEIPDEAISINEALLDSLSSDYIFAHPDLVRNPFSAEVLQRNVGRKLQALVPSTWDEIEFQVDKAFGTSSQEWTELPLLSTVTTVIFGVSNRMLMGPQLARDIGFRRVVRIYTAMVFAVITILQFFPTWLRTISGLIASIPIHICCWQAKQFILPIIKRRRQEVENESAMNTSNENPISEDYLTWQLRRARDRGNSSESEPDWVARRLMSLEFASIHPAAISMTNILLDLLSSDPHQCYLTALREEIETTYERHNSIWTMQALSELVRTDSAIRESLRLSSMVMRSVHRKVIDKRGLQFEGMAIPYGATIATDVWTRHRDPSIYPNPDAYDPFRFSRQHEAHSNSKGTTTDKQLQGRSITDTSDEFLTFGHGRHACPGRFFINAEFKLLLAYMLMNYDFERLSHRPSTHQIGIAIVPSSNTKIKYKRRV